MLLEGIFLPLTTPFHADGRLFGRKLEANVAHYSRTPASGMVALCDVGEPDSLTDAETIEVLGTTLNAAAHDKVMIASVGRESIYRTLELAQAASGLGYDAIAVRGAGFCSNERMTAETLIYFRMVADRSKVPVVLVREQERRLGVEVIASLAEHPNVIGLLTYGADDEIGKIKVATASVMREAKVTTVFAAATQRMLGGGSTAPGTSLGGVAILDDHRAVRTRIKRVGFQVLCGSTTGMLQAWKAGASGAMPRAAACAPQACCEVWQAFRDGDEALAEEKQDRLRIASIYLEGSAERSVAALKCGCDFNGYYGGRPRLPLLPLNETDRAQITRALAGMRN